MQHRTLEKIRRTLSLGRRLEQTLDTGASLSKEDVELLAHRLQNTYGELVETKVLDAAPNSLAKMTMQLTAVELLTLLAPLERLSSYSIKDSDWLSPQITSADSVVAKHKTSELVFVLDNIRSAFNVGSILRTADALGVGRVYCCGYTPHATNPLVMKTSLGAEKTIATFPSSAADVVRVEDVLGQLRSEGYQLFALETSPQAISMFATEFPEKAALLVGNERYGLNPPTVQLCDHICEIPMSGIKNSLNVAVALAVAGFAYKKQHS